MKVYDYRSGFLTVKLKKEIDGLIERVGESVRKENAELKKEIAALKMENYRLKREFFAKNDRISYFFNSGEKRLFYRGTDKRL